MAAQHSFAYVLNRRPFRDNSLLLDLFTESQGRICCVARPAKKRGKVLKGHTEPFRFLAIQWLGKGDVQTLIEADERGRHSIPPSELLLGLYLNELILLFTQSHVPQAQLFNAYKVTLHKIGDTQINQEILMRFELYLLSQLGYSLSIDNICLSANTSKKYAFDSENGLQELINPNNSVRQTQKHSAPVISSELLFALQDIQNMQESHWQNLRLFLDKVFALLAPRPIKTRKLLAF